MSAFLSAYSLDSGIGSKYVYAERLGKATVAQLVEQLIRNQALSARTASFPHNKIQQKKFRFSESSAYGVFRVLALRKISTNFAGGILPFCGVFGGVSSCRRPQTNLKGGAMPHVDPKSPRPTSICPRPPLYYSMAYANPKQGAGMNTIPSAATMARSLLPQPRRRRR